MLRVRWFLLIGSSVPVGRIRQDKRLTPKNRFAVVGISIATRTQREGEALVKYPQGLLNKASPAQQDILLAKEEKKYVVCSK